MPGCGMHSRPKLAEKASYTRFFFIRNRFIRSLPESRKKSNLPPAVTSLLITFLNIQPQYEFPMLPLQSPNGKALHLHASQFSSSEIFYKTTSAFLKTGINLRNLPPAHSRGAVSFSVLWSLHVEGRNI